MKRGSPKRDWSDVDIDRWTPCLVCGSEGQTERAHVAGRTYDRPKPGRKTLWVNPLDVVPLCGPSTQPGSCHHDFDNGRLDLLPYLTVDQQVRVVQHLLGIENARIRLAPSDYTAEIDLARRLSREVAA